MIYLNAMGLVCALGNNLSEIAANLAADRAPGMYADSSYMQDGSAVFLGHAVLSPAGDGAGGQSAAGESAAGLSPARESAAGKSATGQSASGQQAGTQPGDEFAGVFDRFPEHDSRNNRLLLKAYRQLEPQAAELIRHCGEDRVAVILGTSTSGLEESDAYISALYSHHAYPHYHYSQQELGDPSEFLAALLKLQGPAYTISTACSSASRAVISAAALIESGAVDAAIAGGSDSLNRMTVNGFHSMGLLSAERCMPFCKDRHGINVGESAGLVLLSRNPGPLALRGCGQSSDAWHISAPHPRGAGAEAAIRQALDMAGLEPQDVGYISLHGTSTKVNDAVEAQVISRIFGGVPCSSLKHLTGHTLGTAGICGLIVAALVLREHLELPRQDFSRSPSDPALAPCTFVRGVQRPVKPVVMSNSFAFGGNNAVLLAGLV